MAFSLDSEADKDIIRWLNRQANRSSAIRQLVRDKMYQEVTLADVYHAVKELEHRLQTGAVVACASPSSEEWDEPPEAAAALDALAEL